MRSNKFAVLGAITHARSAYELAAAFHRVMIVAAVLVVALGSLRRQKAPVIVGGVVTAVATVHELVLLGRFLPGWVLVVLFSAAGLLLVALGATYERRRQQVRRLRGAFGRMR